MITETQKEAICNTLGSQYSSKIIAHLEKKGITPIKNEVFNAQIIQNIVNGRYEHLEAEIEIVNLVMAVKKLKEKAAKKLETLL
jgi:intracellular sulfur oxidation DsrE/DsrF family protein